MGFAIFADADKNRKIRMLHISIVVTMQCACPTYYAVGITLLCYNNTNEEHANFAIFIRIRKNRKPHLINFFFSSPQPPFVANFRKPHLINFRKPHLIKNRERNREKIAERQREYYEQNKERILKKQREIKSKCEVCNITITTHQISRHNRSKRHFKNVEKSKETKEVEIVYDSEDFEDFN